jgi:pyruvate dehydrogenase E2 component (dihydrolipoamide acetyltransferase)
MPASPAPSAAVLAVEADATDLDWLLRGIGRGGADPAPTPGEFIVKAAAHALASRPADVSIALGVEGVHPPLVLPDPRALSILRFARECRELLARARAGRRDRREGGGAMLVVRDLGALGVDAYTPAVEASARAVLGIGRIVAKEVVTDPEAGRLVVRQTVVLTLVLDPRAADAAVGARFLRKLAWFVEHPIGLLVGP